MNVLLTDDFFKRKKACNYTKETTEKVDKIFHDKLFMDADLSFTTQKQADNSQVLQALKFQTTKVHLLNGAIKHQYLVLPETPFF